MPPCWRGTAVPWLDAQLETLSSKPQSKALAASAQYRTAMARAQVRRLSSVPQSRASTHTAPVLFLHYRGGPSMARRRVRQLRQGTAKPALDFPSGSTSHWPQDAIRKVSGSLCFSANPDRDFLSG